MLEFLINCKISHATPGVIAKNYFLVNKLGIQIKYYVIGVEFSQL